MGGIVLSHGLTSSGVILLVIPSSLLDYSVGVLVPVPTFLHGYSLRMPGPVPGLSGPSSRTKGQQLDQFRIIVVAL